MYRSRRMLPRLSHRQTDGSTTHDVPDKKKEAGPFGVNTALMKPTMPRLRFQENLEALDHSWIGPNRWP